MLFNLRYTLGLLQTTASWGHESRLGGAAQHMWLQNLRTSGQCLQGHYHNILLFAAAIMAHHDRGQSDAWSVLPGEGLYSRGLQEVHATTLVKWPGLAAFFLKCFTHIEYCTFCNLLDISYIT